jgi:putative spermidine/putrescine transport system permease protein
MTRLILTLITILGLSFLALPLFVVILGGLTTDTVLRLPIPGFTLHWVWEGLRDESWTAAILASTALAAAASLAATVLGTAAAIGLSRNGSRAAPFLREALMAPLMLPYIVLGAAILQVSAAAGFMQTFAALLPGHIVIIIPFVLQSTLPLLSREQIILEEASADLGAGPLGTIWRVTLPLIRRGILTGAIFAFIFSWTNVEMSMFQTTSELVTLPVKIYNYVQYQVDPLIAAISGLTIAIAAASLILIDISFGLAFVAKPAKERRKS